METHKQALATAVAAAQAAGELMRRNLRATKKINSSSPHDIKLELDVRCQRLIEKIVRSAFPRSAFLGEEGVAGDPRAEFRWVVDPIDGTVNFTYGIPHACVSIAFQTRNEERGTRSGGKPKGKRLGATGNSPYITLLGVVYDPFCDELWTAIRGGPARLNGKIIRVRRRPLRESIVSLGFAKSRRSIEQMLPYLIWLLPRVRKVRMMGAAALGLTYVASGRFDAYIESSIRLWDIAAGGLILECAGGDFWHRPVAGEHKYQVIANNGRLRPQLKIRF
jgi:myo-inositol-1(or 4)-monophosphatase